MVPFMVLKIYVENEELRSIYEQRISDHNNKVNNDLYPDSGFDLICPNDIEFDGDNTNTFKVDLGIKCAGYLTSTEVGEQIPSGFYVYPRSSISNNCIRLANSTGIIDSGYRGNLKAAFDIVQNQHYYDKKNSNLLIKKNDRLVQICNPLLTKINAVLVNNEDELGVTSRGAGGFGSTGM